MQRCTVGDKPGLRAPHVDRRPLRLLDWLCARLGKGTWHLARAPRLRSNLCAELRILKHPRVAEVLRKKHILLCERQSFAVRNQSGGERCSLLRGKRWLSECFIQFREKAALID